MSLGFTVSADRHARRPMAALTLFALTLICVLPLSAVESSEPAPLAAKSLLLGVTRAGPNLVAVGDRGHILLSKNDGRNWTQCAVPTRAMLTGVSFPDALHGWVVGHDGVILNTVDGGQTWSRQDSTEDLETIFLDVLFLDDLRGFAVGAYGRFLGTQDGGKTWKPRTPAQHDIHYNRISVDSSHRLFLAGESGSLLISTDAGLSWKESAVPYDGSLFGYIPADGDVGVLHGLRGHIFTTRDLGETWEPHASEIKALIMGGTRLRSGWIVLGGQGGNFFISRDHGTSFTHWKPAGFVGNVAALTEAEDGAVVVVGDAGTTRLILP